MKHKPVPIGVVLTGVIYFGLLFYWQWDELSGEGAARDAAIFGIVLAVAHVAYVMAALIRPDPRSLSIPSSPRLMLSLPSAIPSS